MFQKGGPLECGGELMKKKTNMPTIEDAYTTYTKGNDVSLKWLNDFIKAYKMSTNKHKTHINEYGEYGIHGYLGYMDYLLDIKKYFDEKNYAMVCNTIHKMSYFVDLFRIGVYDNLASLIEENIGAED